MLGLDSLSLGSFAQDLSLAVRPIILACGYQILTMLTAIWNCRHLSMHYVLGTCLHSDFGDNAKWLGVKRAFVSMLVYMYSLPQLWCSEPLDPTIVPTVMCIILYTAPGK